MVVRKTQLVVILMTIMMFHLSFLTVQEQYFVGYLSIQRMVAVILVIMLFFNINAFLQKETRWINIAILLFGISSAYTSYVNRDMSGYSWLNILLVIIKTLAPLLVLEYASDRQEEKAAAKTLFTCLIIWCIIIDIHGFVTGVIGQDKTNLLIGNKFQVSYLHIFAVAIYAYFIEQKNRKITIGLALLWGYTVFIGISTTCTTATIACGIMALFYVFYPRVAPLLEKRIFAVILIFVCDSILFINSAILTWGPIRGGIENILHEDITLTGRLNIYQNVLTLLAMNPWIGFGAENNYTMSHTVAMGGNTQNGVADVIVSYGIIGAVLILMIMLLAMKHSGQYKSSSLVVLLYIFIIVSAVEITLGKEFLIVLAMLAFLKINKVEETVV